MSSGGGDGPKDTVMGALSSPTATSSQQAASPAAGLVVRMLPPDWHQVANALSSALYVEEEKEAQREQS